MPSCISSDSTSPCVAGNQVHPFAMALLAVTGMALPSRVGRGTGRSNLAEILMVFLMVSIKVIDYFASAAQHH